MMIRDMCQADAEKVIDMMRVFYASPAVLSNGSEEIFRSDVEYLEGYVFDEGGELLGYAMTAKSFSTEFGKPCVWIEDLYIKPEYRGRGMGAAFFDYIEGKYSDCIFRLEAERENVNAVRLYEKCGYEVLDYLEMKKG